MIKKKLKIRLTIESIKKFKNSENCEVNGVLIDYNDVTTQEFNQDLMVIVLILNMMKYYLIFRKCRLNIS